MTARVFTFEGDWHAAAARRRERGPAASRAAAEADVIEIEPRRRYVDRDVALFERRNGGWIVIGFMAAHDARFDDLGGGLRYAWGIAQAAGGGVEVYRLDRDLSA